MTDRPRPRPLLFIGICLALLLMAATHARAQAPEVHPSPAASVSPSPTGQPAPSVSPSPAGQPASPSPAPSQQLDALAKAAQNPVSNLRSVYVQANAFFGAGPANKTIDTVNIYPVIPQELGDWNIIHAACIPLAYMPLAALAPVGGPAPPAPELGLGDLNYTPYFSPTSKGGFFWGAGPMVTLPTATGRNLGTGRFLTGPALCAVHQGRTVVAGAVVSQQWSVAGDAKRAAVSQAQLQPFFYLNLPQGWYFLSSPVINMNWEAERGQKWLVPIGGGMGRVFTLGPQPVNVAVQAFHHAVKPHGYPDWSVRVLFQVLLPRADGQ